MKPERITHKDVTNRFCYNSFGNRFRLPDYLSTTEVPFYALVKDSLIPIAETDELVKITTVARAFNTLQELMDYRD